MNPELIIFDCDGVLVDSEPISMSCLRLALAEISVEVSEQDALQRFLGVSVKTMRQRVENEWGHELSDEFMHNLQERTLTTLRAELKPIAGIGNVVANLNQRFCVASSSVPERIQLSLQTAGLWHYFEPHVFSSSMVSKGKPAPDLFLHAAEQMDVTPHHCLVIEDSTAGVQAAKAAGMSVLGFTGGSHLSPIKASHSTKLTDMGADHLFDTMSQLPDLLNTLTFEGK